MRRILVLASLVSSAALALGGCSTTAKVVPAPAAPAPVTVTETLPYGTAGLPMPRSEDWRDWPLTPGTWAYRQDERGSIALFGRAGQDAELTLRCDRARGRIYLSRRGEGGGGYRIRTTSLERRLAALPTGGTPPYLAVELGARDPLLDAIGFSRGRFVVEVDGLQELVVPAWAETLRVVEDCRG
ncbi:hypothetical protein IAG41_12400 [Sphingomonas sp. JC676]|uniref:hypothetical protein n=1 Tax=Sphingomonas sp. JC676 TaxID=2768065 RepID=UPI001657E8F9|nr:hypothetical protein [Sphingomonas sp. JC676]MBC9033191.1 hypothetical protein [Sphingomonas sp. JC676]